MPDSRPLLLVLGNQLFDPDFVRGYAGAPVFMAEDMSLCTDVRHHQQKIVLFLAAMRSYADELRAAGFPVTYQRLQPGRTETYEDMLRTAVNRHRANELVHFEIEDRVMERRITEFARAEGLPRREIESPMFLTSRAEFARYARGQDRLLMADFYRGQRQRLKILVDADGRPAAGRWSFDADNRKRLPRDVSPPDVRPPRRGPHVDDVIACVAATFAGHPGDAREFLWPTTRAGARRWLADFLECRLSGFGPYEDAISSRSDTVFHSLLSPLMNLGLLTPGEIVGQTLAYAQERDVPLQSLEGFMRQVIGWREFVRGVYRELGERQAGSNFWAHERDLAGSWYTGNTGIPPLDDAIRIALKRGWTHHIQRLMVVGNLMTLSEIRPDIACRWFMEMYVDSSDWVMGPNVYGMALFSDGGLFATKPYICGSNYLLRMSDYRKGGWCEVVDGLYWRFIDRHRGYFEGNPRLALMPKALDRIDDARRGRIFAAAEDFLGTHTRTTPG